MKTNTSNWHLIVRTLLPSTSSLAGGLLLSLTIIGFHMLLLSRRGDLFLPHFTGVFSDRLADIYAERILRPMDQAFGSSIFGVLTTALVWGLAGWIIYALLDYVATSLREWRQSETDIAYQGKNMVVKHPMHQQFIIRNLWRFFLGIVLVAFTLSLQPVVSGLLQQDIDFLRASEGLEMLKHLGIAVAGWMLIFHIYIVLLRFFVFRTRIFGEILY